MTATGLLLLALAVQHPMSDAPLKRGTVSFDGRGTLGNFVGRTDSVRGAMTGGATLAAVRGWVEARAATLLTGNRKRDKDLRKSLEVEQYPTLRFDLAGVTPGDTVGDTVAVSLSGTLAIHGVTQSVSLPARVWPTGDGLRLRGDFSLNVKDFHIGGLSKLLGILHMNENIVVHVDLTFGQPH